MSERYSLPRSGRNAGMGLYGLWPILFLQKESANFLNTFFVYPEIPVTDSRTGSNMDQFSSVAMSEFHIIDKVKDRRGKGGLRGKGLLLFDFST